MKGKNNGFGKMFWGALVGMATDKSGVQWMVNCEYNKLVGAGRKESEV